MTKVLRCAFVTMFLNAGETTRAVEIAKAVRQLFAEEEGIEIEIVFFATLYSSNKEISYDRLVEQAGFNIQLVGDGLTREEWRVIIEREHKGMEFFEPSQTHYLSHTITQMKEALAAYRADLVIHGFDHCCNGPLAAKILDIPNIAFLPLPSTIDYFKQYVLTDVPDDLMKFPINIMPLSLRQRLIHFLAFHPNIPGFHTQPSLRKAAITAGWKQQGTGVLAHMLSAKLTLVNDFTGYYDGMEEIPGHIVTGPIFINSLSNNGSNDHKEKKQQQKNEVDPEIRRLFDPKNPNKVFLAMGSSGHKDQLISAIQAVNSQEYHTVALVPPTICTKDEVVQALGGINKVSPTLYLTDKFIPSKIVNAMADVAIIHGGQGTVQIAMVSGTPVVAVPFGGDQDVNLIAIERLGAGVRIPFSKWNTESVSRALQRIIDDTTFHKAAQKIRDENKGCDGAKVSAEAILQFVKDQSIICE